MCGAALYSHIRKDRYYAQYYCGLEPVKRYPTIVYRSKLDRVTLVALVLGNKDEVYCGSRNKTDRNHRIYQENLYVLNFPMLQFWFEYYNISIEVVATKSYALLPDSKEYLLRLRIQAEPAQYMNAILRESKAKFTDSVAAVIALLNAYRSHLHAGCVHLRI